MTDYEIRTNEGGLDLDTSEATSHTLGHITGTIDCYSTRSIPMKNGFTLFREQFRPGAFAKTIQENRSMYCFFNHDKNRVLGSREAGTFEVSETSSGIEYRTALPNTTEGRDCVAYLERGEITGSSFGFISKGEAWEPGTDDEGLRTRSIQQAMLTECSPVFSPAYQSTVEKRSFERLAKELDKEIDEIYELATNGEFRSLWAPAEQLAAISTDYSIEYATKQLELLKLTVGRK